MSSSGRKERILISCVTFEVAKIVEPAIHYEATKIHLIHYGGEGVYREFYDEVCNRIAESLPKAEIVEHNVEVYDFTKMMSTILMIIRTEQKLSGDSDIFVNVSAGTSEFSAAALMASMMMGNTIPFNVSTKNFQVPVEKIKEVYYEGDRPIGLAKSCKQPVMISTYEIKKPDEKLVLALGVLRERIDNGSSVTAPVMIKALAEKDILKYTKCDGKSEKPDQKSIMSYQRNFVDHWLDEGWVEKKSKREMSITPSGDMILNTFLEGYRIS